MTIDNLYSKYVERYVSFIQRNIMNSMCTAITLDICKQFGGSACDLAAVFGSDIPNEHIAVYAHATCNAFTLFVNGVFAKSFIPMERLEEIVTLFKQYGEKGLKEYMT